jgi:hypothetical protein
MHDQLNLLSIRTGVTDNHISLWFLSFNKPPTTGSKMGFPMSAGFSIRDDI